MEIIETTPEAEVIAPTEELTPEVATTVEPEQTMGDMVKETIPEEKVNMIPEGVFLGEKKARKAAERELATLKQQIESGASKQEISESISEIAEEHDIDKGFLQKLVNTIKKETESELETKFNSKFKVEEKKEQFDIVFNKALDSALARTPEFKNIVNPDVIKNLASIPANANKTLSQILEETYGNAISGKRTIEATTHRGGTEEEPLDLTKAGKDIEYFNEIMANPKKKAQYNEAMLKQGY